jgi:PilZ domain
VSLRAPIAVPVEIRLDARAGTARVFRLAWNVGEDGLRLVAGLPFESGRLVEARFRLPGGDPLALAARVTAGGPDSEEPEPGELVFVEPPGDARAALGRYMIERLELPR